MREKAFAHFLGASAALDAFRAAMRIPNLLQNLLGEGVLSASFIPVYARLLAEGKDKEATRVARAVGTLLVLVAPPDCARRLCSPPCARSISSRPGFTGVDARADRCAWYAFCFPAPRSW